VYRLYRIGRRIRNNQKVHKMKKLIKTQIFSTYGNFLSREDKTVNGVSPEFAAQHPNWEQDNKTNTGCWNCTTSEGCRDCKECVSCRGCIECVWCTGCIECRECVCCIECRECTKCLACRACIECRGLTETHTQIRRRIK